LNKGILIKLPIEKFYDKNSWSILLNEGNKMVLYL
jgi:hypothetical protein